MLCYKDEHKVEYWIRSDEGLRLETSAFESHYQPSCRAQSLFLALGALARPGVNF